MTRQVGLSHPVALRGGNGLGIFNSTEQVNLIMVLSDAYKVIFDAIGAPLCRISF